MGDIGGDQKEYEFEPLAEPAVPEVAPATPAPAPAAPAPEREPEKVPA